MNWRCIKIPKGWHRSMFGWRPTFKKAFTFEFYLTNSCKYYFTGPDSFAINKLVGFSDGINHQENSFRLGWNYDVNKSMFGIYSYTYVDGQRFSKILRYITPFEKVKAVIVCKKGEYRVLLGDTIYQIERSKKVWGYKHLLYPYFGGIRQAPHDMDIFLKWK